MRLISPPIRQLLYVFIYLKTLSTIDAQTNENCACNTFHCNEYQSNIDTLQFNQCTLNNSLWISIDPIECTYCTSCNSNTTICTCNTESNCNVSIPSKPDIFWWIIITITICIVLTTFITFTIYFLCKVIRDDHQLAMKHIQRHTHTIHSNPTSPRSPKSTTDKNISNDENDIKTEEISSNTNNKNSCNDENDISSTTVVVNKKKINISAINVKDINLTEITEDAATPLMDDVRNRNVTISIAESESMKDDDYENALEEIGNYRVSTASMKPNKSNDTDSINNDDVYHHNKYESFAL